MYHPFESRDDYLERFVEGLTQTATLLEYGAQILVMANACYDEHMLKRMRSNLQTAFEQMNQSTRQVLAEGHDLDAPLDDQLVYLKLMALGFDAIRPTRFRNAGIWELQYNPLRALRPARAASLNPAGLMQPFDRGGFHFNKAFLQREMIWSGELRDCPVKLFYNKFPFAPLHGLLVPHADLEISQYLIRSHFHYIWSVYQELSTKLPGLGFGYNSLGAYASVNHLHFQLFVRDKPLPISASHWLHMGGEQTYPLQCHYFTDAVLAWACIQEMHAKGIHYNLILHHGGIYCLPRKKQSEYTHSGWASGFAWYELAGVMTLVNESDYDRLTEEMILDEYAKLRVQ